VLSLDWKKGELAEAFGVGACATLSAVALHFGHVNVRGACAAEEADKGGNG